MSSQINPLPPVEPPYGSWVSEVSDDVVKLSARSKQQLEQLVATLTELEDLLDPKPAGDGKSLP